MKTEAEHLAEQAAFIDNGMWPNWPLLPMKRYQEGDRLPQTAVIFAADAAAPKVKLYLDVSPWTVTLTKDMQTAESVTFDTVEECLAAGWRID